MTTTTVGFTDSVNALTDCGRVQLAYQAAVDDEGDAALDYLDADQLRERGTFDPVTLGRVLDDPSAANLEVLVEVCAENGYSL